ncbi:potassium channel family protein [Streptomyces kronopolitis]|uniref:potassium channel family protein n=1 Tax=Streptomyces kronopolitis TaxID=1612435 RepID=UPI0036981736
MRALIAGAGRLGAQIAQVLAAAHNDITLIDIDPDRIAELSGRIPVPMRVGDACAPDFLEAAGARGAGLVIAVTGRDDDNLVISLLAKRQFAVPRVAARVNDGENAWMFTSHWGVDIAVPAATPLISLIEEATGATDTVALLRLSKAGVEVMETVITPRSRTAGAALSDIVLPKGTVVATVVREGQPTAPEPDIRLPPGDEVLLVSHEATEQDVQSAFQ